ncbi:MAG: hypothetical protein LQ341_003697 [Variospora aurantia]|nr:MAG: hypothetical protein LQ341_003697 [Variospora aurantia]
MARTKKRKESRNEPSCDERDAPCASSDLVIKSQPNSWSDPQPGITYQTPPQELSYRYPTNRDHTNAQFARCHPATFTTTPPSIPLTTEIIHHPHDSALRDHPLPWRLHRYLHPELSVRAQVIRQGIVPRAHRNPITPTVRTPFHIPPTQTPTTNYQPPLGSIP